MANTEQELKKAIREEFDDRELTKYEREMVKKSFVLTFPLRDMNRQEVRELSDILITAGENIIALSDECNNRRDLLYAAEKEIWMAQQRMLEYRKIEQERANLRSNLD